jgi:hypothetical protein
VTPVTTEQKPAESDGGMSWLVKGVQSDDAAVHGPAMTALAEAGPAAVDPLIALLSDGHVWTRKRAAELLGRIGDVRAAESLAKAIDSITREDRSYESYALREELRKALAAVSPPAPVDEPAPVEPEAVVEPPAPLEHLSKASTRRSRRRLQQARSRCLHQSANLFPLALSEAPAAPETCDLHCWHLRRDGSAARRAIA